MVHWPLMGAVTFGTTRRGLGGLVLSPLIAVPNVTAHPSTASVPIAILLYNGPLLCGFNVPIKGLKNALTGSNFWTYTGGVLIVWT